MLTLIYSSYIFINKYDVRIMFYDVECGILNEWAVLSHLWQVYVYIAAIELFTVAIKAKSHRTICIAQAFLNSLYQFDIFLRSAQDISYKLMHQFTHQQFSQSQSQTTGEATSPGNFTNIMYIASRYIQVHRNRKSSHHYTSIFCSSRPSLCWCLTFYWKVSTTKL